MSRVGYGWVRNLEKVRQASWKREGISLSPSSMMIFSWGPQVYIYNKDLSLEIYPSGSSRCTRPRLHSSSLCPHTSPSQQNGSTAHPLNQKPGSHFLLSGRSSGPFFCASGPWPPFGSSQHCLLSSPNHVLRGPRACRSPFCNLCSPLVILGHLRCTMLTVDLCCLPFFGFSRLLG